MRKSFVHGLVASARPVQTLCRRQQKNIGTSWRSFAIDSSRRWDYKNKNNERLSVQDIRNQTTRGNTVARGSERFNFGGILGAPQVLEDFKFMLQKCRKTKDLTQAIRAHAHIRMNGLQIHSSVENFMAPMLVECGSMCDCQQAFNVIIRPNVHSWTSLILGYIDSGQLQHAMILYQKMLEDAVHPNSYTLVALLRACARLKNVEKGRQIHAEMTEKEFGRNLFVGSALIDMYAKCGSPVEAQDVFDQMPVRDVVLWNALITGYVENNANLEALKWFRRMQQEGMPANTVTFICVLRACGSLRDRVELSQIHSEVAQNGFGREIFVGSSLVDAYAKCGLLLKAQEVFDKLVVRNVVSWTALISGYVENGCHHKALICYDQMQVDGIVPNPVTFICSLKACGTLGALDKGREIHTKIAEKGFEKDVFVGNTLVDMYIKCGSFTEAQECFNGLSARDAMSWSLLISGYAENGHASEALRCFEQMQLHGVSPDPITFVCSLKACASLKVIDKGREIHNKIRARGWERDTFVGSMLVNMYAKCGSLTDARDVFDNLPSPDIVSWTGLITGYVENGFSEKALECFEVMQLKGVSPDGITFVCGLKACGSLGAIDKGQEMHIEIAQRGLERDLLIANSLIDMYGKCGLIEEARQVFDQLSDRNVVSWNTMIGSYGMNHECKVAIECFGSMRKQNVGPNEITFTCLLTACSRANFVLKGQEYFKMMRNEFGIMQTVDHYTCMVDLLSRSGYLREAVELLETASCPLPKDTWTALLSACKTYGDMELGSRCFQRLLQMNPENAVSYTLMANIHANFCS